jgi:hypothetical protein
MDWVSWIKIVGMILTLIFMGYYLKFFIKTIQDDKNGKTTTRCELD